MQSKTMSAIFKAVIFFGVIFGMMFWFLLFSGYRPITAIWEVAFYCLTGGVSILACTILVVYSTRWKTLISCFFILTTLFSFLWAWATWGDDIEDPSIESYKHHPLCQIVSPDGQKTFTVSYRIPAAGETDVWVYYKSSPFFARNLMKYAYGSFCNAKWLDNDRILTYDFSNYENKDKIIKEIGSPEFNWLILLRISIFYGLLVLCVELLKRSPRIIKWLFSTVSKRPQKP
jgi:hypothetical protein